MNRDEPQITQMLALTDKYFKNNDYNYYQWNKWKYAHNESKDRKSQRKMDVIKRAKWKFSNKKYTIWNFEKSLDGVNKRIARIEERVSKFKYRSIQLVLFITRGSISQVPLFSPKPSLEHRMLEHSMLGVCISPGRLPSAFHVYLIPKITSRHDKELVECGEAYNSRQSPKIKWGWRVGFRTSWSGFFPVTGCLRQVESLSLRLSAACCGFWTSPPTSLLTERGKSFPR